MFSSPIQLPNGALKVVSFSTVFIFLLIDLTFTAEHRIKLLRPIYTLITKQCYTIGNFK